MLLSIDDTESAQTSVRRSLTLRESIEDKENIIYGLAVLSRCSRLSQDWDSAILHDTRRLELAISMQNDVLHMEALADVAHAQASLGELATASEMYEQGLDITKNTLSIPQDILLQVGGSQILLKLKPVTMMHFFPCPTQCIFSCNSEFLLLTC